MFFKPIGIVESCFQSKFATPRQGKLTPSSEAVIVLDKALNPKDLTDGLMQFSHIWVIFAFHKNTNKSIKVKIKPPRLQGKTMGALASRTPHRPNPIGLSLVKLNSVDNNKVYISGVDFITGTPVLDIKPYIKRFDYISSAQDGWVEQHDFAQLKVGFSKNASEVLKKIPNNKNFKKLIKECLISDPRPQVYIDKNPRDKYQFLLYEYDITFQVKNDRAFVTEITKPTC